MKLKVKYFDKDMPKIKKIKQGDWLDLRASVIVDVKSYMKNEQIKTWEEEGVLYYNEGDEIFLGLGVAMELPKGYEAYMSPRSSLFKDTGLILTNSVGVIDESYCGDNDEWKAMVFATRPGKIEKYQRLFQFRIQEKMPDLEIEEVEILGNKDRGGYGSTGKK